MKISILSRSSTLEVLSIKSEAEKRGHTADIIDPKNLIFTLINKEFRIYTNKGEDLLYYDAYIPRYFGITIGKNKKKDSKSLILKYLKNHNKILLDGIEADRIAGSGKIYSFSKYLGYNIPLIPTIYSYKLDNLDLLDKQISEMQFKPPYILKDIKGAQGKNIFKTDTLNDIKSIIEKNKSVHFMLQPYLELEHDLRILVLGGRILGAMDKIHTENNFKGNISQGAVGEKFILTDKIKDIVYKSYFLNKADFVGIDIGISQGKEYLLEVNRAPQFRGFNKYMKINVGEEIIKYLEYLYLL
jgi:RimK family alpha-L-glutamate ligase